MATIKPFLEGFKLLSASTSISNPQVGEQVDAPAAADFRQSEELSVDEKVLLLYDQNHRALGRFLFSAGLPAQEVEDVVQETFLRLYHHLREKKREDNLRSWIFQVAHNMACNLRKAGNRAATLTPEMWDQICGSIADTAAGPEEQVLWRERLSRIQQTVAKLTPLQRECLFLRVEGFRYREIAEMLNVGTSTVSGSLRNAIHALTRGVS